MKWIVRIRTLEKETLENRTSEGIDTIEVGKRPIFAQYGLWIPQGGRIQIFFPWWRVLEVVEIVGEGEQYG